MIGPQGIPASSNVAIQWSEGFVFVTSPIAALIAARSLLRPFCVPINTIDKVFADPQVAHLGMARTVTHPRLGRIELV
ncbi:MAG: hypothetical protein ACREFJ_08335, partial [Acetobacteraceae bacterium]